MQEADGFIFKSVARLVESASMASTSFSTLATDLA